MASLFRRNFGPFHIYLPALTGRRPPRPDVVLVQGFATGGRAMESLARFFERQGLTVAIPNLGGLMGYLQTRGVGRAGRRLAQYLRRLPSGVRPRLIGHSMGGMVIRQAIQVEGARDRAAGVITLGSPHRGAPLAVAALALGLGVVSRAPLDLLPLSRTIRRLNRTPWPAEVPMMSIVSRADALCVHPFGLIPFSDGRVVKNLITDGKFGHTELLWAAEVRSAIVQRLAD